MKLAEILNRVVGPVVLGAIFFLVLTPVAVAMRVIGRDAMKRRFEPAASTYWSSVIRRAPIRPAPDQF
jgi:hypothetical protein